MRTAEITQGLRRHWVLAWPLILSNIATPLLGLADAGIAGHLDAPAALASVVLGAELFALGFGAFSFLRMGTTGMVAQHTGAGEIDQSLVVLVNAITVAILFGLILAVGGQGLVNPVVGWIDPAAEMIDPLADYLSIRLWAAPATLMLFALSGWFIGRGMTRVTLALALGVNGLNLSLNYTLAIALGFGVQGIALGTVIAELAGIVCGLIWLSRVTPTDALRCAWRSVGTGLTRFLSVNGPLLIRTLALQAVFTGMAVIAARLGVSEAAAMGLFLVLLATAAYALDGFAFASEIEAGQAFGAADRTRFQAGLWAGVLWTAGAASAVFVTISLGGASVIDLLTPHTAVRETALTLLPWFGWTLLALAGAYWLDGVFIGLTRSLDMCFSMLVASISWLVGVWIWQPDTLPNLLSLFIAFGWVRTLTLGSQLPRIIRDFPTLKRPASAVDQESTAPAEHLHQTQDPHN